MYKYIYLILALLALPITFASAESIVDNSPLPQIVILERTKEIDHLLLLVQKRLALFHEVAKSKWNHNEDIASSQDKLYMRQVGKLASAYGLNKEWTQTFFSAQAEAEKLLQSHYFETWTEENAGEFEDVANYHKELKPYLDRLTKEILQAIVVASPYLAEERVHELFSQKPISSRPEDFIPDDVWLKAIEPLYNFTP